MTAVLIILMLVVVASIAANKKNQGKNEREKASVAESIHEQ